MIRRWYISVLPLHFLLSRRKIDGVGEEEGKIREEIHEFSSSCAFATCSLSIGKEDEILKTNSRLIVKREIFFSIAPIINLPSKIFSFSSQFYERISQEFISIKENRLFLLIYFSFLHFLLFWFVRIVNHGKFFFSLFTFLRCFPLRVK